MWIEAWQAEGRKHVCAKTEDPMAKATKFQKPPRRLMDGVWFPGVYFFCRLCMVDGLIDALSQARCLTWLKDFDSYFILFCVLRP